MSQPEPIGIYLLTGFLGSGKTTLLNHLLSLDELSGRRIALIVNEFGELGVDGQLVRRHDCDMIELSRGSLFCICIKTSFIDALGRIAEQIQPEVVIVEATGVAETCDMQQFFESPGLEGRFKIQANLCLVDALHFTQVLPYLKAATNQVRLADGVIINKCDLLDGPALERLKRFVVELNPRAAITETTRAEMPWSWIEKIEHRPPEGELAPGPPKDIVAVSIPLPEPVDREKFMAALAQLGENLLRLKGFVVFSDEPEKVKLVESVCGMFSERVADATGDGSASGNSKPKLGVTVIVREMDKNETNKAFHPIV